jgi:hypothetical protein
MARNGGADLPGRPDPSVRSRFTLTPIAPRLEAISAVALEPLSAGLFTFAFVARSGFS